MKDSPQAEQLHTESVNNIHSFTGVSSDSPRMERRRTVISPVVRNTDVAKMPVTASPDLSSSMAEFLEKEKLCKVSTSGKNIECSFDTSHHVIFAVLCQ
jgi:hypothetical protein